MTAVGQLPLPGTAPAPAPELPVADGWRDLPRGWGHPFHPVLPWPGALPPAFAHALIERCTRPGDVVLDPACGRGTAPLQASLRRRIGVGVADDPLGGLATSAVLEAPERRVVLARIAELRIGWTHVRERGLPDPHAVRAGIPALAALPAGTLAALLYLRDALRTDDPADRLLRVALAGLVTAPAGADAGTLPEGDLPGILEVRVARLYRSLPPGTRGIAIPAGTPDAIDAAARALRARALPDRARLVIARIGGAGRADAGDDLRRWIAGVPGPVPAGIGGARGVDALLAALRPHLAADGILALLATGGRGAGADAGTRTAAVVAAAAAGGWHLAGTTVAGVTRDDRLILLAPTPVGVARARAAATLPVDWTPALPGRPRPIAPARPLPVRSPSAGRAPLPAPARPATTPPVRARS